MVLVVIEKILWRDGVCQFVFGRSFLTLWDGDCEFLGCRKAFFYTGEVPPTHASSSHSAFPYHFKEETRREEGKRERERDIERERESEIEESDKTRTKFWRSMKLGVIYTPGFCDNDKQRVDRTKFCPSCFSTKSMDKTWCDLRAWLCFR